MQMDITKEHKEIAKKIDDYLSFYTSPENIWTNLNDMVDTVSNRDKTKFELIVEWLYINYSDYRFMESDNGTMITSDKTISKLVENMREEALCDMQKELDICVENEDYRGASEWKKIIEEYKLK